MARGQIEIMGLVIIVILITLIALFVAKFSLTNDERTLDLDIRDNIIANNALNAILKLSVNDSDMLSLCKPSKEPSVLGTYDSIAVVEEETIMDLVKNKDIKNIKENGFTGIAVCQNTMLLKSITYSAALSKRPDENVDYTFDIIREYILKVKTIACPLSKIFEFGAGDTLEKTRKYINGSN